jgi:hypothetical protein
VRIREVKNPLREVMKVADLHCMEEVGLQEFGHDSGNVLNHVELSVKMARREFGIGSLGDGIA